MRFVRDRACETQKELLRLMGQSIALDGEGVKPENGVGVNEGVKALLDVIRSKTSVESFILSRPSESKPYLISAAFECLRERVPMNEAELLGRCRRIRYEKRASRPH